MQPLTGSCPAGSWGDGYHTSAVENPRQLLQPHLRPDEKLLWTGQPDPRVHFMPSDAFLVPFSILWCAFAVYWTWLVLNSGKPRWFALVGLLFVAVGLY